jgi:ABC-type transport system substrate-binding protein
VTLRDGVKFHNGETLTADYVVFIFSPERLTGETAPLPYGRSYFGGLESVTAIDALTVRFVTKNADPPVRWSWPTRMCWSTTPPIQCWPTSVSVRP